MFRKKLIFSLLTAIILVFTGFSFLSPRIVYSFENSQHIQGVFNCTSNKSGFRISEKKYLRYVRTVSWNKGNCDGYGTYDVYSEESTEYWFLADTNIFCGMRKTDNSAVSGKEITYITALDIAKDYCAEHIPDFECYVYDMYIYDKTISSYCISFYRPTENCRTDDEINICVNKYGEVRSLTAYNNGRYNGLSVSDSMKKKLLSPDITKLSRLAKATKFEIRNSYISRDSYGDLNIVYIIDYGNRLSNISVPAGS